MTLAYERKYIRIYIDKKSCAEKFLHLILNLINIEQMFKLATDDFAVKPYIPHQSLLQ